MDDFRPNLTNYDGPLTISPQRGINGRNVTVPWIQELILRGYGWTTHVGTLITPVIGGGNGTVIVIGRPELLISIPAGYYLIPFDLKIECRQPLLAADTDLVEAFFSVDTTQKWDGTGTSTAKTPANLRTDLGTASPATAAASFSAAVTQTIVDSITLDRKIITGDVQGTPTATMWTEFKLDYQPNNPPVIAGPAMLICHYGGTAATSGYCQVKYCVVPSSFFNNLN